MPGRIQVASEQSRLRLSLLGDLQPGLLLVPAGEQMPVARLADRLEAQQHKTAAVVVGASHASRDVAWSMEGCRARLARFEEHLEALDRKNGEYVRARPFEVVPEFDAETGWHTIYLRAEPLDPIFGILVGEAAHQLRAALDNLAWQLANLDGQPPLPHKVQFPIMSREPEDFFSNPSMSGMRVQHKMVLEGIQPYMARKTGACAPNARTKFEEIAWINNTDKHRVVHATASLAEDVAPSILHAYEGYRLAGSQFVEGRIVLEETTEIGKVCIRPTEPTLQMHMRGEIDVGIAFGDRDSPLYGMAADGALRVLKEVVEGALTVFDRPGANGVPPWP